jgi:hypothetical protein
MIEVVGEDLNAFTERILALRMVRESTDTASPTEKKPRRVFARVAESASDDNRPRRFLHP